MAEEVLELYHLHCSDLIQLSSRRNRSSVSSEENRRLQSIGEAVMENLGPNGPGLIAITSVPGAENLRRRLLPQARKLALLNDDDRKRILKEHALGSDVPLKSLDRLVSSFAMQLEYDNLWSELATDERKMKEKLDLEYENLGWEFKELGHLMMDLGLCVARVCDQFTGSCSHELEKSLLGSGSAKARLIHYHSSLDNLIIQEGVNRKGGRRRVNQNRSSCLNQNALWQQWHYDYGIFTVLTDPMFMMPCDQECTSPSGHTYLKVHHPALDKMFMVRAPHESFIVQVGESADVLSKGALKATLHCVCKPSAKGELSRQTFVTFLQPAWDKTFSLLEYPVERLSEGKGKGKSSGEIHSAIPPLLSRIREGMTFAEFSRETTKQYYGGGGLQSKR